MKKFLLLASCLKALLLQPLLLPSRLVMLFNKGKKEGIIAVKVALIQIKEEYQPTLDKVLWSQHQKQLDQTIKPIIRYRVSIMVQKPLISVLIPTYNTPPELLLKTIASIQQQWYPNWELCICDDASTNKDTLAVLKRESADDPRINIHFSTHNRNISGATNIALSMAKGNYVVFLDHDDLLQPQALFRIAQTINTLTPDFIYSDEACISEDEKEILSFVLRPQFSLERLRSTPYIVHLICFNTQFLRNLGGLNEDLCISQDYDLILRTAEQTQNIVHIPEILYLWRTLSTSAGHKMQHKVMATSTKILEQHLARCQEVATVTQSDFFNFFQVHYPLKTTLNIAIIIPTKNHAPLVQQCIQSLQRTIKSVGYEIIVIDHDSDEQESINYFKSLKKEHTVFQYQGDFNFSAINNFAVTALAQHSDTVFSHYLFCNNDIEAIKEGWLEQMLELGQQDDIAIVGPKLIYPDNDQIQHAGVGVGLFTAAEHYAKFLNNTLPDGRVNPGYHGILLCNQEISAVTAACLLIKSSIFDQVDGFDEQLAVGFGDTDLCLKVRALGQRVIFTPHVTLLHHESYTRGLYNEHPEDTSLFTQRWKTYMEKGDPYYNPNYSNQSFYWAIQSPLPLSADTITRSKNTLFQAQ